MHTNMMTGALLQRLQAYQGEAIAVCQSAGRNYRQQFHPDLSPVGWHLGHCIFTESYWIHEMFLEDKACDSQLHNLYNPVNSHKSNRALALPTLETLCDWAQKTQVSNREALEKSVSHTDSMKLMENNFLLHFLIQHYAQHLETMQMIFAQAAKQEKAGTDVTGTDVTRDVPARVTQLATTPLPANEYRVGAQLERLPYDNEYPSHTVEISGCHFMQHPVSNARYLRFIESGGYENETYWSPEGWQWRQENDVKSPAYWYRDSNNNWLQVDHRCHTFPDPDEPVYGLSYHEANAYANWAGGRLPHEHEWEAAFNKGLLRKCGLVWEWCRNSFFPYRGFQAFPYEGYSVPYFDGKHFTLKGGSILTKPEIKRQGFRNYYQADKNFLFAGIRLVFDGTNGY